MDSVSCYCKVDAGLKIVPGAKYAGKPDRERERHGTFLIFKVVPFELPLVVASSRFLEQPCSIAYLWFL